MGPTLSWHFRQPSSCKGVAGFCCARDETMIAWFRGWLLPAIFAASRNTPIAPHASRTVRMIENCRLIDFEAGRRLPSPASLAASNTLASQFQSALHPHCVGGMLDNLTISIEPDVRRARLLQDSYGGNPIYACPTSNSKV